MEEGILQVTVTTELEGAQVKICGGKPAVNSGKDNHYFENEIIEYLKLVSKSFMSEIITVNFRGSRRVDSLADASGCCGRNFEQIFLTRL